MLKKLLTLVLISISVLFFLFDRSFVGLKFFSYPLGYFIVAAGGLFTLIYLFIAINKKNSILSKISLTFFLSILLFLTNLFIYESNLFSSYTVRSSSFLWITGYYVFFLIIKIIDFEVFDRVVAIFFPIPIILYIFNTGYYPDYFMNFFMKYSDKFTFSKASDIAIASLICFVIFLIKYPNNIKIFYYIFLVSGILLPLLLYMSRGSFVGILMFNLILITFYREIIFQNSKHFLLILITSITFFFISTLWISDEPSSLSFLNFLKTNKTEVQISSDDEILISETFQNSFKDLSKKGNTRNAFLSLYIEDGRLKSNDQTTDWRLDIWQDIIQDLGDKNIFLTGYGYDSIIPVMLDPTAPGRLGREGLNENVHNYFVNLLARGGIFNLIIFIIFHIFTFLIWKLEFKNNKILMFIVPLLFISSLDTSMEGVQFPFLYYSYLGILFNYEKYKKI